MSNPLCQTRGMRTQKSVRIGELDRLWPVPDEIIARFGQVRLVRKREGRHELRGGTWMERVRARLWCLKFAPFVGFGDAAPQGIRNVVCPALRGRVNCFQKCGPTPLPFSVADIRRMS